MARALTSTFLSLILLALGCAAASGPGDPGGQGGAAGGQTQPGQGGAGTGGTPAATGSGGVTGQGQGGAAPAGSGGAGAADAAAPPPDAPTAPPGEGRTLVVAAGKHKREASIVTFTLPGASAGAYSLKGAGGEVPVQIAEGGKATFVLPALDAGAEATFTLVPASATAAAVTVVKEADGVKVNQGASTVFRYQMQGKLPAGVGAAFLRGGYLHPIFTPMGLMVTGDYPGDHRHHHGLWSAWAKTSFEGREVDFWNMGGRSAKVDFDMLLSSWEGAVHGGLKTRQVHVSLAGGAPKTALNETWELTVYRTHPSAPPYFVFDLDSVQEAAGPPVMLHQYIYGGFALRGHDSWSGGGGAVYLTSEGKTRSNGDGTDARWCFIGGKVDGKMAGYAALGHPSNFRAPQPVRINPTDQFFSIAPVRDSGFDISAGKPFVSRYRIVVSDGAPDAALLERLWQDYAEPPTVTVK